MRRFSFGRVPWDIVVFLAITSVGFAFSIQRVIRPEQRETASSVEKMFSVVQPVTSTNLSGNVHVVDLGCVKNVSRLERLNSHEGAIRVKGRLCHLNHKAMRQFDGIRVQNKTNGYEATIFFQGFDNSFITDYLVLQSGKNVIQVEWKDAKNVEPLSVMAEVFEK